MTVYEQHEHVEVAIKGSEIVIVFFPCLIPMALGRVHSTKQFSHTYAHNLQTIQAQ